jgi:hypothetical protein
MIIYYYLFIALNYLVKVKNEFYKKTILENNLLTNFSYIL